MQPSQPLKAYSGDALFIQRSTVGKESYAPCNNCGGYAPGFYTMLGKALKSGVWRDGIHPDGRVMPVLSCKKGLYWIKGKLYPGGMRAMRFLHEFYRDTLQNRERLKAIKDLRKQQKAIEKKIQALYRGMTPLDD
jgi:hypothetical protein